MEWIDLPSLKMTAMTIWLAIFTVVIPDGIVPVAALIAAISTIALNYTRYKRDKKQDHNGGQKQNSKQENDDGDPKESN